MIDSGREVFRSLNWPSGKIFIKPFELPIETGNKERMRVQYLGKACPTQCSGCWLLEYSPLVRVKVTHREEGEVWVLHQA